MNSNAITSEAHFASRQNANHHALLGLLGGGTVTMHVQPDSPPADQAVCLPDVTIVCGPRSRNLCGVRFHRLTEFQQFLADNPSLGPSLLTSGPREYMVWCRIDGNCPASKRLADREWLAEGSSVFIQEGQFQIVQAAAPVTIPFRNIVWPPEVIRDFVREAAIARHGLPLTTGRNGRGIVNWSFLVMTHAELWRLVYNSAAGQFFRFDPASCRYVPETEATVTSRLSQYVQNFLGNLPKSAGVNDLTPDVTLSLMGALRNSVPRWAEH